MPIASPMTTSSLSRASLRPEPSPDPTADWESVEAAARTEGTYKRHVSTRSLVQRRLCAIFDHILQRYDSEMEEIGPLYSRLTLECAVLVGTGVDYYRRLVKCSHMVFA